MLGAVWTAIRFVAFTATAMGLAWPAAASGQASPASRNVPVGEWSYEYIKRLRTRGYLDNLVPIAQPYRRHDVARGLADLDPDTVPRPAADWIRLLQAEFGREIERIRGEEVGEWGIPVTADVRASSSQRTDPLRPIGDSDVWGQYTAGAWVEVGAFSSEVRMRFDQQLESDPEGPIDQGRIGRVDNGYLSLSSSIADVWFGRLKQNWSTLGTRSLFLSDIPSAYPALSLEIRVGRFALRSHTGELETFTDSIGTRYKRYVSSHRLEYRTKDFAASLGDGIVFASRSGFMLRFLNPLEGAFLQADTRSPGGPIETRDNLMVDAQIWGRFPGAEVYGQFLVDDIDVHPEGDAEPFTYALTAGVRVPGLASWLELGAEYTQVSAWSYRAPGGQDNWTFLDRGLAQNFSDFDRLTVSADLFVGIHGLQLAPTFEFQRQGEGDFRDPVPPRDIHVQSPALFLGVVERSVRFGLKGRFQPSRFMWLVWDVGANIVENAGHVEGESATDLEGIIQAGLSLPFPF